jgi:D-alanyl-D-alanine carboxypeptidase
VTASKHTIAGLGLLGLVSFAGARLSPGFAQQVERSRDATGVSESKTQAEPVTRTEAVFGGSLGGAAGTPAPPGFGAENIALSSGLIWVFGSKTQHGWAIYIPLIANKIRCDADISTAEFARAVARWQRQNGLPPTGILDSQTWSAMVNDFQSHRLKQAAYPAADQLVTVPAAAFYDPERPAELRQVQRDAYAAYRRMLAAAARDPSVGIKLDPGGELAASDQYMRIISAFRSREYQDQLRKQSPKSGRAGLAVNSPHFSGRALDLYVGGDPVSTKDDNRILQTRTPVYRWLVKNAGKFGFRPYFYEPWHWEYCPE